MSGIKEVFSIYDKFQQNFDKFNTAYDQATKSFEQSEKAAQNVSNNEDKVTQSSKKAADSVGSNGLGGAFLVLNQAMQLFERISDKVMKSLEDIGDKQRSFILLGKEAGSEFNTFAREAASSMGRAESEIRNAGQRWSRLGIGGENIKELTRLADRFANLNPDKEFKDIADHFTDLIKDRNSKALSDLLGGGEIIEQKLERRHIDRYLRQGNITGALEQFKMLADEVGYTQEKADKLGDTFDKKVKKIISRVKDYITDFVSDVVSIFEPYVDKFLGFINNDDVQNFFSKAKDEIVMALSAAVAFVDTVIDGWSRLAEFVMPSVDKVTSFVTEKFDALTDKSIGIVDTLIAIFVGGTSQIVLGIVEGVQRGWNWILDKVESGINDIISAAEWLCNKVIQIANYVRAGLFEVVSDIVEWIADLVQELVNTNIGDMLGIDEAAAKIESVTALIRKSKNERFKYQKFERKDLSEYKVDPIDSVQLTADLIGGALDRTHSVFNRSIDAQNKAYDKMQDALGEIKDDTGKLVGMGQKEQDLRWLKEMAEQRFINEINLRQLTPTINLQVKGTSNQTPNQYAKSLAAELQKMADAGTFNAYGNVG